MTPSTGQQPATPSTDQQSSAQLVLMLLIAAAVLAGFAIGGDLVSGLIGAGLVTAFALVVHLGRQRSDAIGVMGGIGDERTAHLATRVAAICGWVMSVVLPTSWLVTVAIGDPNETLNLLCALYGATFIVAAIVVSRRG